MMSNKLTGLKQSQDAKRMTLADWRMSRIHERTLPSGLTVKLRDVTMTDLMLTGKLPSAIIDMATDTAKSGGNAFDLKAFAKDAEEFNQMLNALIEISLVEPRIGDVDDDKHIRLAEIPADDKMDIFNFMNREAEQLKSFREGESQPVAVV